jgi:hypothetical protein
VIERSFELGDIELGGDNTDNKVLVVFTFDCCDRNNTKSSSVPQPISGKDVRDLKPNTTPIES